MALNDIYKVRIVCNTDTQIGMNVTYWKEVLTGDPVVPALSFALALDAILAPLYRGFMSPDALYRGLDCQLISPTVGLAFTSVGNTGAGSAGGANIPQQVSGLLAWKSVPASRASRGRTYIPFPSTSFSDPTGYMLPAGQAALDAIRAALVATCVVPGATIPSQYQMVHRQKTGAGPPPTFSYNTIVEGLSRDRFATQRRRGQYGRRNLPPF